MKLIFLVLGLSWFGGSPATITMQRTGCEGPCPVYRVVLDSIAATAHVTVSFPEFVDTTYNVDRRKLDKVFSLIHRSAFWQTPEKQLSGINDVGTTTITASSNGRTKAVLYNGKPPMLDSIARAIDKIANTKQLLYQ